jgi:hypothetical protein
LEALFGHADRSRWKPDPERVYGSLSGVSIAAPSALGH